LPIDYNIPARPVLPYARGIILNY